MAAARAGIKTFLIADVRGYTAFTQERGDDAAARLATRFAELAQSKVEACEGSLVELRGDEALAVFDSARKAIQAAIELQMQFVEQTVADPTLPLAVGIGLDAGEAVPVDGGYRGGALNLAARLCSLAGPGEVFSSREVVHLARRVDGVKYIERGSVRLKGFEDPIEVVTIRPESEDLAQNLAFRRALGPTTAGTPDALGTRNPYKGLRAFEEADADDFFGREVLTEHLVERLAHTRFLAVVGPSGSGKSSVVRAGLVPALRRAALPGSERWRIVQIYPGAHPLEELEAGLLRVAEGAPPTLLRQLEDGDRGLARALKRILPEGDSELVLVVDQFEEVFTLVAEEERRVHFLASLEAAVTDPHSRVRVVTTLRADFYDRPLLYSGFAELLRDYVEALVPLTPEEFERAITMPAERTGVRFEPGLLSELVADVANEPGTLPLLQYALTELYERREGTVMTRAAYRAIGGVSGALAGRAEQTFDGLSAGAAEAAHQLFLRLVAVSEGSEDTRRRVEREELEGLQVDQMALAEAMEAFGNSRLLSFDRDPRTGGATVEVAHEALLREWGRLRGWIHASRGDVVLHRRLANTAAEWTAADRDPSYVLRGGNLAQFEAWSARSGLALTVDESDFLNASRVESQRELEGQRRQNRRLKALLAGAGVLLVAAVAAGAVAFVQRGSAQHQATVALARRLGAQAVIEPRLDRAMLLASAAVQFDHSPETEGTLLSTLLRSPFAVGTLTLPISVRPCCGMTLSPDGRTLAVSDNAGHVRFVDTRAHRVREVVPAFGFTQPVAYAANGSVVADFGGQNPKIDVLDANTLRIRRRLRPSKAWLSAPSDFPARPFIVTPDGRQVLLVYSVARSDGKPGEARVDRWSIRSGKLVHSSGIGIDGARAAALIDNGRRLAVAGASRLGFYDPRTLRRLRSVPIPAGITAAFDSEGRHAAVGTETGSLTLVDLVSGRVMSASGAHGAALIRAEFSPDGRRLVTTADDGSVIVWDSESARPLERLVGHAARPLGVAFSSDGETLYTSSLDGAIFEWDLGHDRRFGTPIDTGAKEAFGPDLPDLPPLALAPGGDRFAVRVDGSTVGIVGTEPGQARRTFDVSFGDLVNGSDVVGDPRDVHALAWSPAGRLIAATGSSGQVEIWDVAGAPRRVHRLRGLHSVNGLPEAVQSVAFSPDGAIVAAADLNHTPGTLPLAGRVAAWRVGTGHPLWPPRNLGSAAAAIAFAPDGRRMAVGLDDGRTRIVEVDSAKTQRTLPRFAENDGVTAVAFARDGTLATGMNSGVVRLWNPATGEEIGHPTQVAAAPVGSISFHPDGKTFATAGGSDGIVKLWTTKTQQQFGNAFPGPPGPWGHAQFVASGNRLVVVYGGGEAFVWPTSVAAWKEHACAVAGRNLTREEWARFVGNRPYTKVCPPAR
ncbi:MAG: hypothetical protein QOH23_966 [Gaiellaceae bacterium]|nr:hypothetical protein [Gaiellaceae bacterium]